MPKVYDLDQTIKVNPDQRFSKEDPNAKPSRAIAPNNNGNCEPSRFISPTSRERKEESLLSLSGFQPGTFDTVRLTSVGVESTDIVDPLSWQIAHGTSLGDLVTSGEVPSISHRIYLDSNGNEVERGEHRATLGIDFIPNGGRIDEHRKGDLTVLTIPSAPAMMYGDPTQPLLPGHIPAWLERVQTIVDRYVHCDVAQFNVSRLDSSTVYFMQEDIPAYIGLLNAISPARQRRTDKKFYEGETVQYFNKSQSVGFYDKSAKEDHFLLGADFMPINALRYEVQRKKRQAVTATYGRLIAYDLQSEGVIAKAIKERAKAFDQFFPYNSKLSIDFSNNYNLFRLMKDANKRNHVNNYAKMLAVKHGLVTLEQLDLFMRMEGYSPQYIARHNKSIREMQAMWFDAKDLYLEVKERIEQDLKFVA